MQEHVKTFKGSETMWFFCDGTHPENHAISALPSLASGIEPRSHLGLAIAEASWDYIHGYHGYYIIVAHQLSSEIPCIWKNYNLRWRENRDVGLCN